MTRLRVVPAVAAVAWLPFALACTRPRAAAAPPPLVRTVELTARAQGPFELRGSVASESRIRLGFKMPGVVAEVRAQEGDTVHKGQLVAALDDVDARAQFRVAVAQRDKAKRDADRAARLAREGAVATGAHDDAQSQLEAAEAQLAQAQDALERTRLRAPAGGTVFARLAEPGEAVGAGTPVLILDTTGEVVVRSAATERELAALRVGQAAEIVGEGAARPLAARLTSIARTPNAADGLYPLEVTPARAVSLRPGTLVRIRFAPVQESAALRIPLEAVVHRQDRDFVFLLDEGTHVHQVPIEVDEAEGREVVVRAGLRGGERIVGEGAYFLQDGQPVRTLE